MGIASGLTAMAFYEHDVVEGKHSLLLGGLEWG